MMIFGVQAALGELGALLPKRQVAQQVKTLSLRKPSQQIEPKWWIEKKSYVTCLDHDPSHVLLVFLYHRRCGGMKWKTSGGPPWLLQVAQCRQWPCKSCIKPHDPPNGFTDGNIWPVFLIIFRDIYIYIYNIYIYVYIYILYIYRITPFNECPLLRSTCWPRRPQWPPSSACWCWWPSTWKHLQLQNRRYQSVRIIRKNGEKKNKKLSKQNIWGGDFYQGKAWNWKHLNSPTVLFGSGLPPPRQVPSAGGLHCDDTAHHEVLHPNEARQEQQGADDDHTVVPGGCRRKNACSRTQQGCKRL